MSSDAPPDSPPAELPPESPFRPAPEQPRLGIIHLLVWTACVAVYFSSIRVLHGDEPIEDILLFWLGYGLGSGTALGGLLLFAARRYRGLPFPEQPGETLLVLLGVGAVIGLISQWLMVFIAPHGSFYESSGRVLLLAGYALLEVIVLSAFYLIAILRTKIPRWRMYFVVVVLAKVLAVLLAAVAALVFGPGRWIPALNAGPPLLARAFLVVIAVRDLAQGTRYRWTHWLGVGLDLWNGAVSVAWAVWWIFFAQWP